MLLPPAKRYQFSKSVLYIKMRLVVTIELGTKWMSNSDSASNFMSEYKYLGLLDLPNSFYGYLKSPDFSRIRWTVHMILENGNFQTAVKIAWQVALTQNFAFRHKFPCKI